MSDFLDRQPRHLPACERHWCAPGCEWHAALRAELEAERARNGVGITITCPTRPAAGEVGPTTPTTADGTGRHSRKEMRKATGLAMPSTIPLAMDQELERQMMPPDAEPTGEHLPQCLFGYSGWWCREDCPSRAARENAAAQRVEDAADAAMDALERLMIEFGAQLDKAHTTPPQQRALRGAKLVLVEAGRRVR